MIALTQPAVVLAVGAVLLFGVYVVTVMDRAFSSIVAGTRLSWPGVLAGPARSAALLLLQEPRSTEHPDARAGALAPAVLAGLAAVGIALVPLGPGLVVTDPGTGFVVFAAAVAFVMIAVFLHGWAPNSVFPLHGAFRFAAQALSFQMPFLLAMLATTLPAESLSIVEIVRAQESTWNALRQPLGLPIYLVVAASAAFWGPLDLPDARDLAGGTSAEVSGPSALLWQTARAAMLVSVAAMGSAVFLGGWWGPWLPGPAWVVIKTLALLALLAASRHLLARVPMESFVVVSWVVLLPLALLNIFVAGAFLL